MLKILFSFILFFSNFIPHTFANLPDYPLQFPRDNAAHHDNVPYPIKNLTEWWYYNGKLISIEGKQFGFSVAIFNITSTVSKFKISLPLLMVQLTDIDNNKVYGNSFIYLPKKTFFSTDQLTISLGKNDLNLEEFSGSQFLTSSIKTKKGPNIIFNLQMQANGKELVEGNDGLVPVGEDNNAYYYAWTRLLTSGTFQIGNEVFTVDPEQSSTWMEHVWGDFMLSPNFPWMFANIRLDNGVDINLVDILDLKTKVPTKINHINIRLPDGSHTYLASDITVTQSEEHPYPRRYEVTVPSAELHLFVESLADGQDVNGFWEGISKVEGTYHNQSVHGFGYVQITTKRTLYS